MNGSTLAAELHKELRESQNQRDKRIEELWKRLGPNKKGELDLKGLQRGLRRIDHPMANADNMLRQILEAVDSNGDGRIQYDEFRTFVDQTETQLLALFRSIDRDNNGKLERDEVQQAFKKAGVAIPTGRLNAFFDELDVNNDGYITFEEWRDFLLFMPAHNVDDSLNAILSFYSLTSEGDSMVADETLEGLGYFLAGAIAGGVSRTATAPLDRLKVYLLVNTSKNDAAARTMAAFRAFKPGMMISAATSPFMDAVRDLWKAGGVRNFFAGNALNVVKIMPETAIKFGSYEATKRAIANFEGHGDAKKIHPYSKFAAGGIAGMIAQFCVYPLDTLKFRLQCETTKDGLRGNALLLQTAKKMMAEGGARTAYRGVTMGLVGMFPYSAIDMGTFEFLKTAYRKHQARRQGVHPDDIQMPNILTGVIGATSGAFGASIVYPLNVLRTRLQTQGTVMHSATYTGIVDVAIKTIQKEGYRGLYKGLTPNLLKVAPALSITWVVYEKSKQLMDLE